MIPQFAWLFALDEVEAVLLVGSHARGDATENSDIDLVILTQETQKLLERKQWIESSEPSEKVNLEDYDAVQSLRVHYASGLEIEYGITNPTWASLNPIDPGTIEVLKGGYKILYDARGNLSALCYKFEKIEGDLLDARVEITEAQTRKLIDHQFPNWKTLALKPIDPAGWCNSAFRLGDDFLIKIPRAKRYEHGHVIESMWLNHVAENLRTPISRHIASGKPSQESDFQWTIYTWVSGQRATNLPLVNQVTFAKDLSNFLKELWLIKIVGDEPQFFDQNFYRGGPLITYDDEVQEALEKLEGNIDVGRSKVVWQESLESTWEQSPVWIHGDLFPSNILIKNNALCGVIDFGSMCVGDPACDLVMFWTFFKDESRQAFKEGAGLDEQTWKRAKGWALWKALITLAGFRDKNSANAIEVKATIETILND